MVSDVTSVIFSWNFRFSKFSVPWHRSLFVPSSGVTHLFGDMTPRIESHMWENNGKNTAGPNEFTDFEKFEVEHPETTKTILATNSPNHPGDGITLRQKRSSSHFRLHDTKAWLYQAPALRICLAIWHHESKATCEKTMGKIRLDQTNSPISRNSRLNNPTALKRF